jgi:2-polyprenyl-3-methyl-5-hydroxy-6-metoxy-1,4-benzoquinol methylase
MSCCCSGTCDAAERHFGQKRARKDLEQYRAKGPGSTTRLLLAGLSKVGPPCGTLLDVGSGIGTLMFELLEQGMTTAIGVDLSSAHIAVSSEEATRRGRSQSTRFVLGDFVDVAAKLTRADVVTLDRVVCCYSDCERLLDESIRHAGRCIALSYPQDVWYVRHWVSLENLGRKIFANPFRTFVHSAAAMEARILGDGFELADRQCTRTWCADVYVRVEPGARAS